ncbi:MAG: hypothetical protein PF482_11280 [Desulfobacteraceae bacterium]|nr:hypothetical protein [Desulfobacteraceae bacterium]
MKISSSFYISSWLKNSLMAIGTGFVLGHFSTMIIHIYDPPINFLIGAVIAFILYQLSSFKRFFGSRRGEFEYEYRIDLAEKIIKKLVFRTFGLFTFIKYFQDQFNALRTSQKDICRNLLKNANITQDNKSLYYIYYKLSNLELREDNFKEEINMLNLAISVKANDLLANFRLAVCYEMDGFLDDAIKYYHLASNDPYLNSDVLKKYILSQVERIEQKGPMHRPPALGAKYQAW